ncbi:MAG: hypothetical protein KAS75_00685 [Planctomycetes bacterium]|nr:hypothetical protein [Planctomycetota bacterium]
MIIKNKSRHAVSLLGLLLFLILAVGSVDSDSDDLNASVEFTGSQFVIENKDSFDWTNVELKVNSDYVLKVRRMTAGEIYTVGAMQFAKSGGEKFNPFTHKALNFSIYCDTPSGMGFYYGGWE